MRGSCIIAAVCLLTLGAQAQESRFQLERSGDGFIRLDRQTGEISRCKDQNGQTVCRPAADERMALMAEIDRLEERIEALDKRVAALEAGPPAKSGELPSEEEMEQSLGLMEQFMRRFFAIIQDLERQFGTGETPRSLPERI